MLISLRMLLRLLTTLNTTLSASLIPKMYGGGYSEFSLKNNFPNKDA